MALDDYTDTPMPVFEADVIDVEWPVYGTAISNLRNQAAPKAQKSVQSAYHKKNVL